MRNSFEVGQALRTSLCSDYLCQRQVFQSFSASPSLAIIDGPNLPMSDWADAAAVFEQGSATDRVQAERLSAALEARDVDSRIASYFDVFLNRSGAPRKILISRGLAGSRPEFTERLTAEQNRLVELIARRPSDNQLPQPAPSVPAQRPAALEPVWKKGRLTLPKKPAKTDLSKKKFAGALAALRNELHDFSEAIAGDANIDRRFVAFIQGLPARIPDEAPSQDELFRLGHVEEVFAQYSKTVDDEWPAFMAAHYHSLALQFDRTMRQAPSWREFKRNAAQQILTTEQITAALALANEAASALRDQEFIDPAVPAALEQLADRVHVPEAGAALDVIEVGMDLLAADLIESINNILKRIAESALPLVIAAAQRAESVAGKMAKGYADGFEKGAVTEAKKVGQKHGAGVVTWLNRLVVGGSVGGATYGGFVGLSRLIAQYPEAFQWLTHVLRFFESLSVP
jgi:hypothetical protein